MILDPDAGPNATIRLPVLSVASDDDFVEDLARALVRHDVVLERHTFDPTLSDALGPMLVVLSENLASDRVSESCLDQLRSTVGIELLPVVLGDGGADLLPEFSHVRVTAVGLDRAAERIAIVARTGSGDLAAWNAITGHARWWFSGGRATSDLLNRSAFEEANQLLLRPIARLAGADRNAVAELVQASAQRLRRRATQLVVLTIVLLVVLVTTTVTALGQRSAANTDAARAVAAARSSESLRLLQAAQSLVATDPDLPWMLIGQTARLDPSIDGLSKAARIRSQLVPHRTTPLREPAISVIGSSGARIAVVYFGATGVDVIDTDTMQVVGAYAPSSTITGAALSPDGRQLAVASEGNGLELVDVATGEPTPLRDLGGVQLVAWPSSDTLIAIEDSTASITDQAGATLYTVQFSADVTALHATPDGWAVVVTESELVLVDLGSGDVSGRLPWTGAIDVQSSPAGDEVLVRDANAVTRLPLEVFENPSLLPDFAASGKINARGRTLASVAIFPVPLGDFDGSISVILEGAQQATGRFAAHQGPVTGLLGLEDGSWVSVGSDARLRRWDTQDFFGEHPGGFAMAPEITGLGISRGTQESRRNMLGPDRGSDLVTVAPLFDFSAYVVDRFDLSVVHESGIGMMNSPTRPGPEIGRGLRINFATGQMYLWDAENGEAEELPPSPQGGLTLQSALSPDENYVAVAGPTGVNVLDRSAAQPEWDVSGFSGDQQPISLEVDNDGVARVLTSSGRLVSTEGAHRQLSPEGVGIAAARTHLTGRTVLVSGDGRVFVGDRRRVEEIEPVDADLGVIAVRISPSGELAALIGSTRSVVLSLSTERVIFEWPSQGNGYEAVADVSFDGDDRGAVVIRASGALSRSELPDLTTIATELEASMPRSFSDEERAVLQISEVS